MRQLTCSLMKMTRMTFSLSKNRGLDRLEQRDRTLKPKVSRLWEVQQTPGGRCTTCTSPLPNERK